MQRLEVSCEVRRIYTSLGAEGLIVVVLVVQCSGSGGNWTSSYGGSAGSIPGHSV
jgi:hypothetical protein